MKKYKLKKLPFAKMGQSLLEAVVAIAVLVTGIIAGLSLSMSLTSSQGASSSRLAAVNLAREGIEVVRMIRDSNWLAACPTPGREPLTYQWQADTQGCFQWDTGLYGGALGNDYTAILSFIPANNRWSLDFDADAIEDSETRLYLADNLYLQAKTFPPEAEPANYWRLLILNPVCQNDLGQEEIIADGEFCPLNYQKVGIRVLSAVKYLERNREHRVTAEERIYNWR